MRAARKNFQLGALYALATAALLATQEPFSALAAKRLPLLSFLCLTQFALLTSVPFLIAGSASRRDFFNPAFSSPKSRQTAASVPGCSYVGQELVAAASARAGLAQRYPKISRAT